MKQSVIIEAQGISVFHRTQCLQTILVHLNAHKVYKTINSQNYKLTLFLKYIWHVLCVSCIFLNCCGFNRPSDLRLVGFGVGSCCALSWKKQSLAAQCGYIWAFKSVFWLRQPSLPWMKKAWEIHTASESRGICHANVCSWGWEPSGGLIFAGSDFFPNWLWGSVKTWTILNSDPLVCQFFLW